ncbi:MULTISPECIES: hypothetical protein [unclassified Acinetobacter]|uniref:hypothetical protein n=1 Tax=unclassified Acinetobacter TaxID=196816 RepID=UPI00190D4C15|nr:MULTISPECIES: hypothetical protein [unclassified Acinetobacter]MBK0063981.1 hypothetical protein [Acinetobacter sp. S55]MBK0067266.1 hypothetical protein [Acinetobacter sp. S54]
MSNIALKVFWNNNPMPVAEKVKNPELLINVPFGAMISHPTSGGSGSIYSVNGKTGTVVLNASDVNAEPAGSVASAKSALENEIEIIRTLAQTNELKISTKTDQADFEVAQQQIEQNRLALLTKADIQALALLSQLVDTKADQSYVNQQIANLVGSAPEALNTIYELAAAIQNEQSIIETLNQSVANRVRFDVATQALSEIQKDNARTNIGAEKLGTAQQLVSQITAHSLGAATAAQGAKADTALQSGDVAPVALSGLFSSLTGQSKIFDVVYSAYALGANTAILATDTLGMILGKLQAQINAKASANVWVNAATVATFSSKVIPNDTDNPLQFAVIDGFLWIRGMFTTTDTFGQGASLFEVTAVGFKPKVLYPALSSYVAIQGFYAAYGSSGGGQIYSGLTGIQFIQKNTGNNFFGFVSTNAANSSGLSIPPTPIAKV